MNLNKKGNKNFTLMCIFVAEYMSNLKDYSKNNNKKNKTIISKKDNSSLF
jgi:hypothetical protein